MSTKVTFKFEPSELVFITRSLNHSKKSWTKTMQGMANVICMKIGTFFCELDESEMKLITTGLRTEALRCVNQGFEEMAEQMFILAGGVDQAMSEFNSYWSKRLQGGN